MTRAGPVLKRKHGDGHWVPWAQGHWLWTQPGRTSAIEVEVKAISGGFVYRPAGSTGAWQSVLIGTAGEWEWSTPTECASATEERVIYRYDDKSHNRNHS